jgi:GTP-binding protein EngB required for normal cell division
VHSRSRRDALACALDELTALAGDSYRERAAQLSRRLAADRLRVMVVGEAKRGKSTLVNAMLGRAVLPAGVVPLTAIPTTLVYGRPERVESVFWDGVRATRPLTALGELVTESGNPHNRRGLAEVTVFLDADLLGSGIEVVDTPGTGSVYAHNTTAAEKVRASMDAAVLVLSADPPASQAELDLLAGIEPTSVATFVLLNKADRLDRHEFAQALEFTASVTSNRLGRPVRVYPCSARDALTRGADPGLEAFLVDFRAYLERGRAEGLELSLLRQGIELAGLLRDEVRLTLRADQMRAGTETQRVEAFRSRSEALATGRRDAQDRAQAEVRRLLEDLGVSAQRATGQATATVERGLEAWIADVPGTGATAHMEQRARDLTLEAATELAEAWRKDRAAALDVATRELGDRLAGDLEQDLAAVREAAKDLLGVALSTASPGVGLAAEPRFHYAPPAPEGPAEALAAAVRTRIPGRLGRERALARLRGQVAESVDRQFGRARADLQSRLERTRRALEAEVRDRYAQYSAHLTRALDAAELIQGLTRDEADRRRTGLVAREREICDLIAALDALRVPAAETALAPALPRLEQEGRR